MSIDQHVVERAIQSLKPSQRNPRTHSTKQIRQLANSIETFGFTVPVLVDEYGGILAGHGRVAAAKLLGWDRVPTLLVAHLSESAKQAYILADNKLAENAGWDAELLRIELGALAQLDLEFDLTVTGFEAPEIDVILGSATVSDGADEPPGEEVPANPVSQLGDFWLLGKHRLLCGDATGPAGYLHLLDGNRAQMVFTDPPYNVPIDGHVSGLGRIRHNDFAMACGELTPEQYSDFLARALRPLAKHSIDGSLHFIFIDWRHVQQLLDAGNEVYSELKNLCVWVKSNGGMGSLYRSQHELVCVFKSGRRGHVNNIELGKHGRNRTNVWSYPGANTFRKGRIEELSLHPTVKPVALVADAILDASNRNGIVLDPFMGSGTTILAADRTGRVACGMEIDPRYVDTVIRRWEMATNGKAVHAGTDLGLEALAEARGVDLRQSQSAPSTESDDEPA